MAVVEIDVHNRCERKYAYNGTTSRFEGRILFLYPQLLYCRSCIFREKKKKKKSLEQTDPFAS